jgi:RimJ/RimL family protein N-acetyltransferase
LQRAIFVPEDHISFYLFRSPSADAIREAMTCAGLRSDRITPAVSTKTRPTPFSRMDRQMTHALDKVQLNTRPDHPGTTTDSTLESGSGSVMGRGLVLRDGSTLRLYTPTPDDYEDLKSFYDELSQESLYNRFHGFVRTDFPAGLDAEADGDDRVALAAWQADRVVACGSYDRLPEPGVAEIAFTVADDLQGRGIATQLLEQLTEIAAEHGIDRFVAEVEASNTAMRRVFDRAGFSVRHAGVDELLVSPDIPPTEIAPERVEEDERRGLVASLRSVLAPAPAAAAA